MQMLLLFFVLFCFSETLLLVSIQNARYITLDMLCSLTQYQHLAHNTFPLATQKYDITISLHFCLYIFSFQSTTAVV